MKKHTFEFVSKMSGKTIRLEAEYESTMATRERYWDGYRMEDEEYEDRRGELRGYLDDKKVGSSPAYDCDAWWRARYSDSKGMWIVHLDGGAIGMDDETAERYNAWIDELVAEGTDAGAAEHKAAKEIERAAREAAEEVEDAKRTIEEAERQQDIPDREEARRRTRNWINVMNEGGEGYVPHIVTIDEYEAARETLRRYGAR